MNHAVDSLYYLDRQQELLNGMLRTAESRYAAGRGSQQDILRAQTQLAIYATQRVRYEQTRAARQIEINALLNGRRRADRGAGRGDGCAHSATLQEMLLQARRTRRWWSAARMWCRGSELAASLARKDYARTTPLGGYFNQAACRRCGRRSDFKLPAYFWRKQRAEVTGRRRAPARRATSMRRRCGGGGGNSRAIQHAEASLKLVNLYEKTVIPEARLAYESRWQLPSRARRFHRAVYQFHQRGGLYTNGPRGDVQSRIALAKLEELTGVETR